MTRASWARLTCEVAAALGERYTWTYLVAIARYRTAREPRDLP